MLKPEIFRAYDIRGIVDQDLTPDSVELLGRGIGTYIRRHDKKAVILGRDCRLSSPRFAQSLTRGLLTTGCDVQSLGTVPTPLLYFCIYRKSGEAGIMITGSHNPPEYNGFKMMIGHDTLFGPSIQEIRHIIEAQDFVDEPRGRESHYDITAEYHAYVVSHIDLKRRLKVVVDAGNGTGGTVAVPIFRDLGCDVVPLYCEMDGHFPHHHPDPTLPDALEDLIRTVKETEADLGVAYDGDSDRIGIIDDRGEIIWGDRLLILLARDILPRNPGAAVISEVKASQQLYDEIARLGGRPIMWKTGHSLIKAKIKQEKALLAGEMSGHIFFADRYFGFDDAIYSSARVLEILSRSPLRLSQMLADLPKTFITPEIRIYASDAVKFKIVDRVRRELAVHHPTVNIDGVRATFPRGWALVRASNTQDALVLRFEAETAADLEDIKSTVEGVIENVIKGLDPID